MAVCCFCCTGGRRGEGPRTFTQKLKSSSEQHFASSSFFIAFVYTIPLKAQRPAVHHGRHGGREESDDSIFFEKKPL
jgi:hypothetical protein